MPRYSALIVILLLGALMLWMVYDTAKMVRSRASLVASTALCWDQNVVMRGKLPQWEH